VVSVDQRMPAVWTPTATQSHARRVRCSSSCTCTSTSATPWGPTSSTPWWRPSRSRCWHTPSRARAAAVSHSCACIGSPCLRHCVHGASIGGGGGGGGATEEGRGPARCGLRILSNLCDQRLATARFRVPASKLAYHPPRRAAPTQTTRPPCFLAGRFDWDLPRNRLFLSRNVRGCDWRGPCALERWVEGAALMVAAA
jgi:hypothetical protein